MKARNRARFTKLERQKHETEGRIIQKQLAFISQIRKADLPEELKNELLMLLLWGK